MARRTINLSGGGVHKEAVSAGVVMPGHLVAYRSAGTVGVHNVAAGNAAPLFARENELEGEGIDTAYAADDRLFFFAMPPGEEVNALVAAGAPAIAFGDYLESAGDGTLRKVVTAAATADTQRRGIVAQAMEAVDNSGGSEAVRIIAMTV